MMHNDDTEEGQDVEMEFCGELNIVSEIGGLEPSFDDQVSSLVLKHYYLQNRMRMGSCLLPILDQFFVPQLVLKNKCLPKRMR